MMFIIFLLLFQNQFLCIMDDSFKPKLVFHCQLAHGSPTGVISDFQTVKQLYQKIADCFDIPVEHVLFCTLNTHKLDMDHLLGSQIALDDFIFAHIHGQHKEIEVYKGEGALGLTITDNGNGIPFIKRIKPDSIMGRLGVVFVGDHIEKINDESLIGQRHYDVAKILKDAPVGCTFKIRLVSPMQSGFSMISRASNGRGGSKKSVGAGTKTLRFRPDGVVIEDTGSVTNSGAASPVSRDALVTKINSLLDNYMGIADDELALSIVDLALSSANPFEFQQSVSSGALADLDFPEEFILDMWGAVSDEKRESP